MRPGFVFAGQNVEKAVKRSKLTIKWRLEGSRITFGSKPKLKMTPSPSDALNTPLLATLLVEPEECTAST